jgi:Mg2+ and Co2+ transporter CorA
MFDFYYSQLLSDPTKLQPRDGNRYIELVELANGSVTYTERDIDEHQIVTLLQDTAISHTSQQAETRSSLRLIIGSPEEHESDAKILPLPFSKTTFEAIRTQWNMPTELLRMMLSSLPLSVPFKSTTGSAGILMRGARSRDWNFCVAVTYDPSTRTTLGLINGMQEREVQKLVTCLQQSKQLIGDPTLVPLFLLELRVHFFAVLLENRAAGIEDIEYETGMRHGFSQDPQRQRRLDRDVQDRLRTLDFHSITRKLTGVTGTLSFCDMAFETSQKALDLVKAIRTTVEVPGVEQDSRSMNTIQGRINYLEQLIAGANALSGVLDARTKAQVQTVYSLIGQRDNSNTMNIATISLQHNQAMNKIALDSKQIAKLTRRDSADMRIIAWVTLVFLPGTFIATCFGSNLFQFIPSTSPDTVVSKWIWLYAVLTTTITAVVLVGWWQFSRRQWQRQDALDRILPATSMPDLEKRGSVSTAAPALVPLESSSSSFGAPRERSLSKGSAVDDGVDPCAVFASP